MANAARPGFFLLDTVGWYHDGPFWLKALEFVPANAGDAFVLSAYDLSSPANITEILDGTITSATIFTENDAGNKLPSTFAAGNLFHIFKTSGSSLNLKKFVITTAGDNSAVVGTQAGLTNEANKAYSVQQYAAYEAYGLKSQATTLKGEGRYFGNPGIRFDNLSLTTLTSGAKLYLFI